ncbi:Box C/D snoRNA accumulation [Didymosphaeria variabile]|uniref:Box C/D snoRNA protein 1 n=1 Tax=Didymosphaeria variabile TaxID=1932322 RepID=A0A9W8XM13_9PLEO|nr:Box C/D snoRNA accumulation [Didymosphaeria variabile]KAJ4354415.1 Box C/D snoRNA accumulation [Didymosphaeria variabile]
MADDALLSDLCSICNTVQFKYRCPGCSARTCSLPCYKRHQQWAQCDGKRDPTKFVKKSQLATPAGIDHDYNFLTGIERGLEKAEKQLEDPGLGSNPDPRRDAKGRQPTDQHFAGAGVTVIRAPKGLSRQKDNKTHKNKQKNIVWTVEWIYEETSRILTQSSSAGTILQAQPFKPENKKRKRGVEQSASASTTQPIKQDDLSPIKLEEAASTVEQGNAQPEPSATGGPKPERLDPGAITGDGTARDATTTKEDEVTVASDNHRSLRFDGPESEPLPPKYAFYLLRPRTSSNRHVLIRLEPTATLGECLRGRTVLEFPTIYVFPESTYPPQDKFMLEAEYLQQEGEEQKELEDLLKHVSPETLRALKEEHSGDNNAGEQIDSDRILDVLKQDMGAGA